MPERERRALLREQWRQATKKLRREGVKSEANGNAHTTEGSVRDNREFEAIHEADDSTKNNVFK